MSRPLNSHVRALRTAPHVQRTLLVHEVPHSDSRGCAAGTSYEDLAASLASSYSAAEREAIACAPPALRPAALLGAWAAKEAVIKALGAGVSFGMARVECGVRVASGGGGGDGGGPALPRCEPVAVAVDGVASPPWLCVPRARP